MNLFYIHNEAYSPGVPGDVHEHVTNNYTYSVGIPVGAHGDPGGPPGSLGCPRHVHGAIQGSLYLCNLANKGANTHGDTWGRMDIHAYPWVQMAAEINQLN